MQILGGTKSMRPLMDTPAILVAAARGGGTIKRRRVTAEWSLDPEKYLGESFFKNLNGAPAAPNMREVMLRARSGHGASLTEAFRPARCRQRGNAGPRSAVPAAAEVRRPAGCGGIGARWRARVGVHAGNPR
jgi:hypothetical protein